MKLTIAVVIAFFYLLLLQPAMAARQPMTIEQVEEKEAFDDFFDLAEEAMVRSKDHSDVRFVACLKAFGHKPFCECMREELPSYQSFDSYFFIITTPKDELNYRNLEGDDKKLIDNTYVVRDKCVKQSF